MRSLGWKTVALVGLGVVVLGVGTTGAVCKFGDVSCGLNPYGDVDPPTGIEDFAGRGGGEVRLPEGFAIKTIASGLSFPTGFAFLPDAGILIAQKDGLVHLVRDGQLRPDPFLDLRGQVATWAFRGVTTVEVDPEFPREPYVYLSYAIRRAGVGPDAAAATSVRVSRFRVDGDDADPASEEILVGRAEDEPCRLDPPTPNCLPAPGDHIGADIEFAPDGSLYVSTGDGSGETLAQTAEVEESSLLSGDVDALTGKILRIDRSGKGLPDNPWWNGDPNANRSKVWALGLRNPFRIARTEGDSEALVVGDVGWQRFEELNVVRRGEDHGWPCYEGPERTMVYESHPVCRRYYGEGKDPVPPWLAGVHPEFLSITGGVFLGSLEGWPEELSGRYVFGDWATSQVYTLPLSVESPAGEPELFAANLAGPVEFASRAEGLYVLSVNTGELRLIAPS